MWRGTTVGLALVLAPALPSLAGQDPVDWASVRREETAREAYQRVADIFEAMRVGPGAVVADIGAGEGFLTARLGRAIGPEGRALAVDIDGRALERLRARIEHDGLTNVDVIRGDEDDPHLLPESLDAAVIVNSYHEMRAHQPMLHHLRRALKPGGRLVIVEPLSEKRRHESREVLARAHEIALPFVEDDVRAAGFRVARTEDPFTTRGAMIMWLLVAVPEQPGRSDAALASNARSTAPSPTVSPGQADESAALSNPDLRMPSDRFKQLRDCGAIVVLDVRTETEYRSSHIPDAISVPFERVSDEIEQLRGFHKPIVTYCG